MYAQNTLVKFHSTSDAELDGQIGRIVGVASYHGGTVFYNVMFNNFEYRGYSCITIIKHCLTVLDEQLLSGARSKFSTFDRQERDCIDQLYKFLYDDSKKDMQAIARYLLTPDINPYDIFGKHGNILLSLTGFVGVLNSIHHALYDDGEISFPIVNKNPRIYFDYLYDDYEQVLAEFFSVRKEKIDGCCTDVFDFSMKSKEYYINRVRRCFCTDAAAFSFDRAVELYSDNTFFSKEWLTDQNILSDIEKYRDRFKK